jgi:DNA-binding transcriptional ArsR family regulator
MGVPSPSASLTTRAQLFHGFSDYSRVSIVEALRDGERRVSDVVEATGLTQPNVSMHLACLWECGLVAREKRGREVYYRLIAGVADLLAAADGVLAEAGQTIGACPRYGSGKAAAA